jgi:large subunit ribosomal protein L22
METKAVAKNVRTTSRKARMVVAAIKGLSVDAAKSKLQFMARSAGVPILKVLNSAVANAKDKNKLEVKNILVDDGIKMKRRDTSHGARFGGGMISKRTSHITVILENKETQKMGNEPSREKSAQSLAQKQ